MALDNLQGPGGGGTSLVRTCPVCMGTETKCIRGTGRALEIDFYPRVCPETFLHKPSPHTLLNRRPHVASLGSPPPKITRLIRHNPMSRSATAAPLDSKGFSCQLNISSSCRYHEEMANKERDLITGNKSKDVESLIFFCIASNCNQQ